MGIPCLDEVFPGYKASEVSVISEQLMGFSGAKIQELSIQHWEEREGDKNKTSEEKESFFSPPSQLFVKHIVFCNLDSSATEVARQKDIRNRHSYINETAFIESVIPYLEQTGDFFFPKTYKVQHHIPSEDNGAETFTFFTDSLTPLAAQVAVLDTDQMHSVLAWTARLHAIFHGSMDHPQDEAAGGAAHVSVLARHPEGLWSQGTHIAWEKRPASELEKLAGNWKALTTAFSWPELKGLGDRLASAAPFVAQQLSVANKRNVGRTTVVHGDVKPGNIFFLHEVAAQQRGCGVALIDYQWSGVALGVTDIVYLLATSATDEFIQDLDVEEGVLRPYYTTFSSAVKGLRSDDGRATSDVFTFEELVSDFQLAVIDYVRWTVSCRLGGETPEKYAARRQTVDLNLGSYRRSDRMLKFLFQLVERYLPRVESEQARASAVDVSS